MLEYIVEGGRELYGAVTVSGSKNAALPVIFATLTVKGVSEIYGVPDIGDVRVALDILKVLGASVERSGSTLRIYSEGAKFNGKCREQVSKLRASTYLLGACLPAFGRVCLMPFGGCNFSLRPIDIHLEACAAFGAVREGDWLFADKLRAADFTVRKSSVGASVNSLILAASVNGESVLKGVAREPHIDTLISFLISAGAKIRREGDTVYVLGGELREGRVRIPADMIEAGSFLMTSAIAGGRVKVVGAPAPELTSFLCALRDGGVEISEGDGYISAHTRPTRPFSVVTGPYPAFPTDLQPIIAPLMGKGQGGEITDTVWQSRFGYLERLGEQGLKYKREKNRAVIYPSEYRGAEVFAEDLRGGMASLLAALGARGRSVIKNAEIINRGYDDLVGKLSRLGASILVK